MNSVIDMSLEDIIKKKKIKPKINKNKVNKPNKPQQKANLGNAKFPMNDARNKIISKKRTQITDAREKLAQLARQRDARVKLDQLRQKKQLVLSTSQLKNRLFQERKGNNRQRKTMQNRQPVFSDQTRQIMSQPHKFNARQQFGAVKKFMETRSIETRRLDHRMPRPMPILRTVENDIMYDEDEDDPMGEEEVVPSLTSMNRKASLNLKIVAHNNDNYGRVGTMRSAMPTLEREKSPPRLQSILKKRPMAALRSDRLEPKLEETVAPTAEYRIIVSNLNSTVTAGDIQELFGDVGGMLESRLVRPGTAEVIYKTAADAQRAVDLYHNRQLDKQPMNCLLVAPKPAVSARGDSKPLPASSSSNVEPDISTFHKVLFGRF